MCSQSVNNMLNRGVLKGWQLQEGGHWRVDPESVARLKAARDDAYTVEEVMVLLSIRRTMVSTLIFRGDIKAFRVGRRWRIDRKALDLYISKRLAEADIDIGGHAELRRIEADRALRALGKRARPAHPTRKRSPLLPGSNPHAGTSVQISSPKMSGEEAGTRGRPPAGRPPAKASRKEKPCHRSTE